MSVLAILGGTSVRTLPFKGYRVIGDEEKLAVARVLDSGILSKFLGSWEPDFYGGPEIRAFEKEWAAYFGVKYAITVNSCTSGIQCAVAAIGIGPGDEVIVSPYTMVASVTPPLLYGAIPVFADVEPKGFCLDVDSIEKRITPRTKAIIVASIFGQPFDADPIMALARKHGLKVIEDCAQSPGAMYKGRYAGTLADIGIFSLNYHKHIHTGEGGVIVTNDDALAERLQLVRNHAEAVVGPKGVADITNMVGYNFRMTEIEAAIGRCQLRKLKGLVEERSKNCEYLAERIGKLPGIEAPPVREGCTHVYYVQPFLFHEEVVGVSRDSFVDAVVAELPPIELRESEGVRLFTGGARPIYLLPLFQKRIAIGSKGWPFTSSEYIGTLSYEKGICPVVERLFEKEMILHELMRPPATTEDLDDVVMAFYKVYAHRDELVAIAPGRS
jgi:dTDP-4-amino-4,6-dideoxygalactose transaminase